MLHGHPAPLRWLIGIELARHRSQAKLSLTEASTRTGYSRAKIGHLETGRQHQEPKEIARLLHDYGAGQADVDQLVGLAGRTDDTNWWWPWAPVIPQWLTTFVGLEGIADTEFVFEPTLIPGLLQTVDYASAVSASPTVRPDHVERVVDFRMARARLVTDSVPQLHLHAVFTEAALHMKIGSEVQWDAQLRHIAHMAALPTVTIQVVSTDNALDAAGYGRFVMLGIEGAPSIGFVELIDDAVYLHEPHRVHTYATETKRLKHAALDPARSLELVKSMTAT